MIIFLFNRGPAFCIGAQCKMKALCDGKWSLVTSFPILLPSAVLCFVCFSCMASFWKHTRCMQTRSWARRSPCWRDGLFLGYMVDGHFGALLLSPREPASLRPGLCSLDVWLREATETGEKADRRGQSPCSAGPCLGFGPGFSPQDSMLLHSRLTYPWAFQRRGRV